MYVFLFFFCQIEIGGEKKKKKKIEKKEKINKDR